DCLDGRTVGSVEFVGRQQMSRLDLELAIEDGGQGDIVVQLVLGDIGRGSERDHDVSELEILGQSLQTSSGGHALLILNNQILDVVLEEDNKGPQANITSIAFDHAI